MEGDFTRNSDDAEASYSGVLAQQGRVQLDADWNEQWAIQTRALRDALRDVIGAHGGPEGRLGFEIVGEETPEALAIGGGVYYVDGIRCEARAGAQAISLAGRRSGTFLAFLDVWERHVNAIEDPRIREVALLGPDTATRAEVRWRVRLLDVTDEGVEVLDAAAADELVERHLRRRPRRRLAARARTVNPGDDPCQLSPLAMYRGRENQLYRVQIHDALPANPPGTNDPVLFTFKWSRDNGSIVFPIVGVAGPEPGAAGDEELAVTVTLGHLGREARFGLVAGDVVEFVHDALGRGLLDPDGQRPPGDADELVAGDPDPGRSGLLGRVLAPIDVDAMTVRVAVYAPDLAEIAEGTLHPYLRRWDQRDEAARALHLGAVPVRRSELGAWLALEHGIEVRFEPPPARPLPTDRPLEQRAGDHWQIPARVATGDVLWPRDPSIDPSAHPAALVAPHGPHHHHAPLAFVTVPGGAVTDVRRRFKPLAV